MPFDPTKPANGSLISAAELRAQFTALDTDIADRATHAELAADISGTSSNTNGVDTLDVPFGDPDAEALRQKLNELILAARR